MRFFVLLPRLQKRRCLFYLVQPKLLEADDVQVKVCPQARRLVERQSPCQPVPVGLKHRERPGNDSPPPAAGSNAIQTMMLDLRRGILDMTSYCTPCNIRQCY